MRYTLLLLALLGASCSSTLPSVKPYHLDVQQGNVVTAKMMMQLKPGMTKSQVRYVLGTPLLQDAFHQNRWDYIYQMAKGGKVIERRRIILDFESDSLKAVRGDVIPSGAPGAEEAPIASVTDLKTVKSDKTLLAEDPKTTWYDRFKFWSDDKEKSDKAADKAEVNKTEVKAEPKAAANQTPEKSWYDSLKFWESDKKTAPEVVKPAQVAPAKEMPVQKAPEPVVAEAPQAPAQEALQSVEPSASEEVVDTKAAVKEVVDQVVDQPAQLAEETKPEQSAAAYQEAVAKALNAWASAWRNKNVSAYLKAYSDNFQPEGMGKKAWVAQRTQRVGSKSGAIALVLDKVSIQADAKKATTSFVQRYASGNFSDVVNKVMSFENANGQWLIVKESVTTESLQSTVAQPAKAEAAGEMYVKPRDVTPDEKSEAMPEKLLQESAKQAQQVKPAIKLEPKPVEAKPAEMKPVEIKQPAAKAVPEKAPEIKPTARKDAPLPSEDAPDFFERMLEKIGF